MIWLITPHLQTDRWGVAIYEGLQMLAEWLQKQDSLFPSNFVSNFAARVLSTAVCSRIAKVIKLDSDQLRICLKAF